MRFSKISMSLLAFVMAFITLFGSAPLTVFAAASARQYFYIDGERVPADDERVLNYISVRRSRLRSAQPDASGVLSFSAEFSWDPDITMGGTVVSAKRYCVTVDGVEYEAFCANPNLPGPDSPGAVYELAGEANAQIKSALKNGYPINTEWSDTSLSADDRMWSVYVTRVAVAIANNPSSAFAGDGIVLGKAKQLANGSVSADANGHPPVMVNGEKDAEDSGRTIYESAAKSQDFNITYSRKTNQPFNAFKFEWAAGTPDGAKLIVNGSAAATAPDNPNTVYKGDITSFKLEMPNEEEYQGKTAKVNLVGIHNPFADRVWYMKNPSDPDGWQGIAFYIPEVSASAAFSFEPAPGTPDPDPTPTPTPTPDPDPGTDPAPAPSGPPDTKVIIEKVDALSRENIPGALVRLRGISSHQIAVDGGPTWELDNTGIDLSQVLTSGTATASGGDVTSAVSDGVWTLEGLPYGAYVAEEERAPDNYSLLPQHTAYGFWVLPPNLTIKQNEDDSQADLQASIDAMLEAAIAAAEAAGSEEPDIPALLEEIKQSLTEMLSGSTVDAASNPPAGPAGEPGTEPGTGSDTGFEIVEEEGGTAVSKIVFENYPFGEIEVVKYDSTTNQPLAGAHIKIEGYFPEGSENGVPVERTGVTDSSGKVLFDELPAGNYTVSEVSAPAGYVLDNEFQAVPLTWGQKNSVTFYNRPKTWLEVIKVDGNTGATLSGARFELTDPATGERWEAVTNGGAAALGQQTGSQGNELLPGNTYILTELAAPAGYVLLAEPISVVLKDTGKNTVTVENFRNPSLTIVKRDKDNGQPRLAGAVFEVSYENGQTVSGSPFTTDGNGEIVINEMLFEGNEERTLIITEKIPPAGYNLSDPDWQRVTLRKGENNVVVFENTRKPTLEIVKTDAVTGKYLQGAEFTIEKLEEPGKGLLTGNPFVTDAGGRITLPYQYSGKYRVVEIKAPENYWLDPQQQNREWIIEIIENEDYTLNVENTLLPTLIITKWNAVTYKPVPMTRFRVEYETPNSSQISLVGEFVTNKSGQVVIPYTHTGWYRITEIKPAPGMSLNTNNSYRVYLNPGDNSYMPIPDVTGNNPGLNTEMPLFKDIQVFGGNDFFSSGAESRGYPADSFVIEGSPGETFTIAKTGTARVFNARAARSAVQVDVTADVLGEFSADSSGILVLGGLEAASYDVTGSEGMTKTAAVNGDGSVARLSFTAAAVEPVPTPEPMPLPDSGQVIETATAFDGNIEYIENAALASQVSRNVTYSNGEQYWNSGMGIWNFPLNSIVIKKQDATNGNLLAGASFDVIYTTAGESGTKGTVVGTFTTDHSGVIVITGLEPGNYVVEETQAPPKYTLAMNNRQNVNLKPDGSSIVEVMFSNFPYGSLLVNKIDSVTRKPVAGAQFLVTDSRGTVVGTSNGLFLTDSSGSILVDKLPPDTYIVTEKRAPSGYVIGQNAAQTIQVQPDGKVYRLEFTNDPLSSLVIRKIDSYDGSALSGAMFEVRRADGEYVGEYTTGQEGLVEIQDVLGRFTVTEKEAPNGYAMDTNNVRSVDVRSQAPSYVTFYNPREGSLTIEKADGSGSPLSGAQFRVSRQNGEFVGNHTTNASGMISIPNLASGFYYVEEIQAPKGYIISTAGQSVEVRPNSSAHLTFVNLAQPTLTIRKVDETGSPLNGARFMVSQIGGSFSKEVVIGTGGTASLVLPIDAAQASFQIVETQAPKDYTITEPARVITIRAGENVTESFVNYKTPSLVINKHDADGNPLSGAVFEIRSLDGTLAATATSNIGGVAAVGSIAAGSYEITETRAPAGYVITGQSQIITVTAGETASATFINEKMPGLTIEKADESGKPLSGAVFEVRTLAGALVEKVTTNSGGVANIARIAAGSYTITETAAPKGYVVTEQSRTIEIAAGQSLTERFVNFKQPSIIIEKVDINGRPLANAVFEVRGLDGAKIAEAKTNSGGTAAVEGLTPASYEIVETQAPSGYAIIEQSRVITVAAGDSVTVRFVNYKQPSLIIEKVDSSGSPLSGAEFEIRKLNGEVIKRATTDKGGLITVPEIAAGAYVIAEVRAPRGYALTEPARNIEIIAGQSKTERFVNYRQATLTIEKVDGNGAPLANAEFEVRKPNGDTVNRVTTDKNGIAIVVEIPVGAYVISETRAPQGYVILETARNVEIIAGQDTTERFVNHKQPSLIIEKVDGSGTPLSGAEFEIRRLNGELVQRITTDNSGVASVEELPADAYIIAETRAPQGYVVTETARSIQVVAGQSITERFVNHKQPSLVIQKVDGSGNPLSGAVFEVRTMDGTRVAEVTTDNGGMASVPGLAPGAYEIIETRAPQGYVVTETARSIQVVAGQSVTERFVNHRQPSLIIEKVDGDGNPLSDAVFEVRTLSGEKVAEAVTDNGGMASVPGLAPGAYEIIETRAPQGYVMTEVTRSLQVTAGQSVTERFVNHRQPSLIIEKVDGDGNPLFGAVFEVRTLSGEKVAEVTTDSGGMAAVTGLTPGAYEIIETVAPQGYVITEISRAIQVVAGQSVTERFINHRQPNLIIEKVDGDGNPLANAIFEVRGLDGAKLAELSTDSGGMAAAVLDPGAYEVIEVRAPQGYVVTETSRAIQIVAGETRTERFTNYRQPALIIEKVDENGQPLEGAEFEIRRLNGELVHRVVTNNGGTATIEQLTPNSYELIETRAPEGYALVEVSRSIQIVAGQTVTERFVNPRLATFVLEKIDGDTQQPLTGVIFEITTLAGEKIRNPQDGSFDFITDNAGMIRLPQLEAGSYVAVETKALFGYALAKPEVFEVGHDKDYIITVRNYKLPDYNILKIDGNTDKPLAGVPFEIASYYSNGRVGDRIRNPQDGSYTWMTDSAGMIRIPNLNHGTYVATEVRPPAGYSKADPAIFVVGDNEPTTITVRNYRYSEWNILKINGDTNKPLQGVVFEVARYYGEGSTGEKMRDANGNIEFITDSEGMIRLGVLEPGTYSAIETKPLDGYIKAEPTIFTVTETDENTTITIRNYKRPVYNISKIDGDTNKPLQGVVFELAKYFDNGSSGERVRNPIDGSFEFVTDAAGIITIPTLPLATYVATEIRPLPGYAAAEPQVFVVDDIQDTTITIRNYRNPDFAIRKLDGDTREPLAGVRFQIFKALGNGGSGEIVRNPADNNDIWMTDSAGLIHMNALEPGAYVAAETKPLPGYTAAEPVTFTVGGSGDAIVTIFNYRLPDYAIKKVDGETNAPLAGVAFEISRSLGDGRNGERLINPADGSAIFVTDSAGMINLPGLEPGNYIATETKALQGYTAAEPKPFTVGAGGSQTIVIQNFRLPDFSIQKVDGDTQQPLAGVAFEISRHLGEGQNGERLVNPADGTNIFVTDSAGMINLPGIAPGMYMAIETRPLKGYLTAEPAIFTVGDGQNRTVVIQNFNRGETTIKKADADTGSVLPGVVFEISRLNGEKVQNPVDNTFEFVTDNAGLIPLGFLTAGTYTAVETRPLEGYEAGQPTTFEVKDGGDLTVLIKNQKQSSLTVRKLNSVTREPIEGVAFQLSLPNGEKIMNPKTGFYDFITDNRGIIFLPALEDGAYWLTEIKAADGYFGLKEPVLVEINNETRQREYLLEIENEPASGLLIIKTDAQTKKPLAGVIFEIRHADGRVVQGGILNENMPNTLNNSPQLNSMNGFTTDESGRINLNHLEPGLYHVIEKEPLDGYELDTGVRVVTVEPGTQAVLEVENKPLSGLRIRKLDSITGEPIFGVEFMLFDQNGKPVGNFYSDDRGVVDFPAILVAGRYTIRETRPAEGYNADDMPRTVDFVPGKVTEIEWTNVPIGGQLQISKVSGDYNEQNALPAGTLLPGAIFEIYSYRTGSLVDRIISDQRGMAVSKPLPLGRYYAVEVQAPAYYTVNPSQIDFDIEFDRQIVKTMFPNFSANLGVTIDKTGPRETMQGHSIVYDFKTVRNDSSVPLGDFYWRDILPVDAVRADKLVTGTYNVSLRYKVLGKTNYGNEVVIADNLITTSNNVIELKPVHLGLAGDEFLTEFTLYFGQAPAGFTAVEKPKVYVDVLWESYAILPNGMMFANKADIGGRVAGSEEWVVGNSTTATTIFSTRKMPQSGY